MMDHKNKTQTGCFLENRKMLGIHNDCIQFDEFHLSISKNVLKNKYISFSKFQQKTKKSSRTILGFYNHNINLP